MKTYRNSNSYSVNARRAEYEGRHPLRRAIDTIHKKYNCKKHKVTKKIIREVLEDHHDGEWHHVGPFAQRVDYFDTNLDSSQLRELVAAKRRKNSSKTKQTA